MNLVQFVLAYFSRFSSEIVSLPGDHSARSARCPGNLLDQSHLRFWCQSAVFRNNFERQCLQSVPGENRRCPLKEDRHGSRNRYESIPGRRLLTGGRRKWLQRFGPMPAKGSDGSVYLLQKHSSEWPDEFWSEVPFPPARRDSTLHQ